MAPDTQSPVLASRTTKSFSEHMAEIEAKSKGASDPKFDKKNLGIRIKLPNGASIALEYITPQKAATILARTGRQRKISAPALAKLVAEFRAGRYILTADPIKLRSDGSCGDGQHRLRAIQIAGISVYMMVMHNTPDEVFRVIDSGKIRNIAEGLIFESGAADIDKRITEIARTMQLSGDDAKRNQVTRFQQQNYAIMFKEKISQAARLLPKNKPPYGRASIAAPLARALYHYPDEQLEKFAAILLDGGESVELGRMGHVVIKLRNFVISLQGASSAGVNKDLYGKTEATIKNYCENISTKNLVAARLELFPVPGEADAVERERPAAAHAAAA